VLIFKKERTELGTLKSQKKISYLHHVHIYTLFH